MTLVRNGSAVKMAVFVLASLLGSTAWLHWRGSPTIKVAAAENAPKAQSSRNDELLGRITLPDVPLIDQTGRQVRLAELARDRVVVASFVYTSCSTICPVIGACLKRLQTDLGERLGRDVALLTITLDPVTDTPERMATWGRRFGAESGWYLLGGNKNDIDTVLKAFGVYTAARESHAPIVLMGSADRSDWRRIYALSAPEHMSATVEQLIARAH